MYVVVTPKGSKVFRYDYRIDGKRKTLTIGKYGRAGLSLEEAREACLRARKMVSAGISPSVEKQRKKRLRTEMKTVSEFAQQYLDEVSIAESTRAMRASVLKRDIVPDLGTYPLDQVTGEDVRWLCRKIKLRGAPSTAVFARDILKQMYAFAILQGINVDNPANEVAPASIARFKPKDRSLTPEEIRIAFKLLERVNSAPDLKLGFKLILLTMKRKAEVSGAKWEEIDFESATWTIPKERMKNGLQHIVYLSRQALDILMSLRAHAYGSSFVFPKRYEPSASVSAGAFNRLTYEIRDLAKTEQIEWDHFTIHDLRRTGSTLLNELGFNRDWIEKALAHEDRSSSRGIYNKAQYAAQRRHMMQEWANCIDAWILGEDYVVAVEAEG